MRTPTPQTEEFYEALKLRRCPHLRLLRMNGEYHGNCSIPSSFTSTQLHPSPTWSEKHQRKKEVPNEAVVDEDALDDAERLVSGVLVCLREALDGYGAHQILSVGRGTASEAWTKPSLLISMFNIVGGEEAIGDGKVPAAGCQREN